jgi:hypothetical protein
MIVPEWSRNDFGNLKITLAANPSSWKGAPAAREAIPDFFRSKLQEQKRWTLAAVGPVCACNVIAVAIAAGTIGAPTIKQNDNKIPGNARDFVVACGAKALRNSTLVSSPGPPSKQNPEDDCDAIRDLLIAERPGTSRAERKPNGCLALSVGSTASRKLSGAVDCSGGRFHLLRCSASADIRARWVSAASSFMWVEPPSTISEITTLTLLSRNWSKLAKQGEPKIAAIFIKSSVYRDR